MTSDPARSMLDEIAARGRRWRAQQARYANEGTMSDKMTKDDELLYDAFYALAGALQDTTVAAILADLEGWRGPVMRAARHGLADRKEGRDPATKRGAWPDDA